MAVQRGDKHAGDQGCSWNSVTIYDVSNISYDCDGGVQEVRSEGLNTPSDQVPTGLDWTFTIEFYSIAAARLALAKFFTTTPYGTLAWTTKGQKGASDITHTVTNATLATANVGSGALPSLKTNTITLKVFSTDGTDPVSTS